MSLVMLTPASITERIKQREKEWENSAGTGYITGLMELWLKVLGGPRRILELGTYTGNSAFAWLACPNTFVTTVDTNHDNLFPLLLDVEHYDWKGRVSMVKADSIAYAEDWTLPLDMVYIDTTHEYLQTRREIEAWTPHIKSQGWLVLDDIIGYPHVAQAFKYAYETSCQGKFDWFMGYLDQPYTPRNHGIMVARIK